MKTDLKPLSRRNPDQAPAPEVTITPATSREDIETFIRLPFDLYKDDPLWVPPIIAHQRDFLDKTKGPFFEVGQADYYLARRGDRVVGRISAHVNGLYERHHDAETGFFGFFECENDQAAANALFETAAARVRQWGKRRLHGPLSFGIYDEVGLLVDGFDSMPCMMHTHNPPYYQDLVLSWGFGKTYDWYAYAIRKGGMDYDVPAMKALRDRILTESGCRLIHPRRAQFVGLSAEVREMFNDIWSKNWGHVPLTDRQFHDYFVQLQPLLRRDLLNLIMDGDEVVAFSVVSPDMNRTLHRLGGKLGPLGLMRLMYDCRVKPLEYARAIIMGVKKSHQWKKLHHAIIIQIIVNFLERHPRMVQCDCSLIPESLVKWNKTLKAFGGTIYKTFRLYDRDV